MRVKDEPKAFQNLQNKLIKQYRAYTDKGHYQSKVSDMKAKYSEVLRDLRQYARTYEQSIATAKKLFELADCAVRVSVQEDYDTPVQEPEQSEDEDMDFSMDMGYG